jgi:hypothetical protein
MAVVSGTGFGVYDISAPIGEGAGAIARPEFMPSFGEIPPEPR